MKAEKLFLIIAVIMFGGWLDPYADYVRKGNSDFRGQDYKSAVENYDKAAEFLPSKSKASDLAFNKGAAYAAKGSTDSAEEYYREALKSENRDVQKKAFYNLGNMYSRNGDAAKAADAYMNALKIDPEYSNARVNLENLMKQQKKDDKKNDESSKDDRNKKDEQQKQQQKNGRQQEQNDEKNPDKNNAQGELSREQIDKILDDYKNMPVKRMKGNDENGVQVLDKDW